MNDKEKKEDKNVISKKIIADIKRKSKYNDEGDEAVADFTYDAMLSKKDRYKDMYGDYRD